MSTPLTTIADALIDFIMSLLRDPAAMEEFDAEPQAMLARNGLSDACVEDVRAVAPVVIDHPNVHPSPPPPPKPYPNDVIKEIKTITNNLTIDNRSTIVDQSVNQNIWTDGGDVNQIFDNEANVASGDESIAAGDDVDIDNTQTDIETGDIAIGNETTDVDIEGSFNDESTTTETETEVEAEESFNDTTTNEVEVEVDDSFNYEEDTTVNTDIDVEFESEEQL